MADPRTRIPPSAAKALRGLTPELRLAGAAAAALLFTMILPWYEKSYFATTGRTVRPVSDNLSALQVFSFVEAAVLLVAAGVLYLIWARSQNKAFHLPGGDGTVIMAAGAWALLLLVWRLFDKPDVDDPGATVGIQWGIFAALLAAGLLTAAGGAGARRAPARAAEPGGRRRRLGPAAARGTAVARVAQPAGADHRQRGAERGARVGGRAAGGARARADVGPAPPSARTRRRPSATAATAAATSRATPTGCSDSVGGVERERQQQRRDEDQPDPGGDRGPRSVDVPAHADEEAERHQDEERLGRWRERGERHARESIRGHPRGYVQPSARRRRSSSMASVASAVTRSSDDAAARSSRRWAAARSPRKASILPRL